MQSWSVDFFSKCRSVLQGNYFCLRCNKVLFLLLHGCPLLTIDNIANRSSSSISEFSFLNFSFLCHYFSPVFAPSPVTYLSTFHVSFTFSPLSLLPPAIHSLKLSRTHVDWHSVDEVYLYSDATTSKIARTVTQKLGFSKGL